MRRPRRLLAAVLLLALLVAGCAAADPRGSGSAADPDRFRVLAVLAMSGPLTPLGEGNKAALEAAADDINSRGGILGRQVEIDVVDSQGNPTNAVSEMQKAIAAGPRPDAVYSGITSNESLAMQPILTQEKIFNIASSNSEKINDPVAYPYTFRPNPTIGVVGEWFAAQLKGQGYTSVGLLAAHDALGQSIVAAYTGALERLGIRVVVEQYAPADLDLTAPMQRLAASSVDVLVGSAIGEATQALILKARAKVAPQVPLFGDVTISGDLTALVSPQEAADVRLATFDVDLAPSAAQDRLTEFARTLQGRADIVTYLSNYTLAYDALHIVELAATNAGSADAGQMAKALENLTTVPPDRFLTFQQLRYTPQSHFNVGYTDSDFAVGPLGPRVAGQYTSGGQG